MAKLSPNDGGCWFCSTDNPGPWLFSVEFDTNVHERCLKYRIEDGDHPEANIMAREFGMDKKTYKKRREILAKAKKRPGGTPAGKATTSKEITPELLKKLGFTKHEHSNRRWTHPEDSRVMVNQMYRQKPRGSGLELYWALQVRIPLDGGIAQLKEILG